MVVPGLDAFNENNRDHMILGCLGIGALHLTLAHGWVAVRYRNRRSLGELGWILVVAGLLLVAVHLLVTPVSSRWIMAPLVLGLLLAVLCGEQTKAGFWRDAASSLRNLPLTLMNGISSFSDLVSYIRLFAVGLATKEVAVVFNEMALGVGVDTILAVIGCALILLLGHTVNLLLAAMGVLVHAVRLNLLEFSRHLQIAWSGIPYQPFGTRLANPENLESKNANPAAAAAD